MLCQVDDDVNKNEDRIEQVINQNEIDEKEVSFIKDDQEKKSLIQRNVLRKYIWMKDCQVEV